MGRSTIALRAVVAEEKVDADEGAISTLAQAAEGSMRDGLSLLDQVIAACGEHLDEKRVRQVLGVVPTELLADVVRAVDAADSRRVLERVGQLAAEGYELAHFCGELTRFVRDLMVGRTCGAESALLQVPSDERQQIGEIVGRFSEEDLSRFFNILLRAESEMRYALVPRFHLELALMKMVHARRLASLETLLSGLGGGGIARQRALSAPRSAAAASRTFGCGTAAPGSRREFREAPGGRSPPRADGCRPAPARAGGNAALRLRMKMPRLAAIKTKVYGQSNFLGSCLEHMSSWRFVEW